MRAPSGLSHGRAVWVMVAVTFMWSIAGVVTRQLEHARSFEVTFWRSVFTLISLLILLPALQGRTAFAPLRHGGPGAVALGPVLERDVHRLHGGDHAHARVPTCSSPWRRGPCSRRWWRVFSLDTALPPRTWVAIVVAGLGIAYMYGTQVRDVPLVGTLVALCVPLAAAVNWTVMQHAQRHGQEVDLMPAVLVGAVLSTLATAPFAWPFAASLHDLWLLAFLGLVQLAIPCLLVVRCGRVLKAPEMALLGLLEVIFGICWPGWVLESVRGLRY